MKSLVPLPASNQLTRAVRLMSKRPRLLCGTAWLAWSVYLLYTHSVARLLHSSGYWASMSWAHCLTSYLSIVNLFVALLYLWEHILVVVRPGPRRLSLRDDYVSAEPPVVDRGTALRYDTPMTTYEWAKGLFFFCTGILLLRVAVGVLALLVGLAATGIAAMGSPHARYHPLWRCFWESIEYALAYVALICMGVYDVKVFGTVADRGECKLLIGNHTCITEVLLLFLTAGGPSFLTRQENLKLVLFPGVVKATQAVVVDRNAAVSKQQTLDEIVRRAGNPNGRQLMIFPEGTTANQRTLFLFKKGAFEARQPVQMVCITFPYRHFNAAWTGRAVGGNNIGVLILRLCSQFVNHAEMRFLPVYYPTEAERENPMAYARHCQKMMAAVLGANISDATYRDYVEAQGAWDKAHRVPLK